MGFFRLFSKEKSQTLPDDLEGLLAALAEQHSRIQSAVRIAGLRSGLLESAVRQRQSITVADGTGPSLVTYELSRSDARKLAKEWTHCLSR